MSSALTPLESEYCSVCNVTTPTRVTWVIHLASNSHHLAMRAGGSRKKSIVGAGTDRWDRSRSIKISDCDGLSLFSIVEYLDSWGPVENFCHLNVRTEEAGEKRFCYALMKSRNNANNLVFRQELHRVPPTDKIITIIKWMGYKSKADFKSKRGWDGVGGSSSNYKEDEKEPELKPLPAPQEEELIQPQVPHIIGEYSCVSCSAKVSTLSDWVLHLCSAGHRKAKNIATNGLRSWDCSKGIYLFEVKGFTMMQILEWAVPWGHVSDFICCGKDLEIQNAYLLFEEEETANYMLRFKDYLVILGHRVQINPIAEFSGYSKAEKQMLKAEKLTSEMISIASSVPSTSSSTMKVDDLSSEESDPLETERNGILNVLTGKPLEEQFSLFLIHSSWPESFYQSVGRYIQDVLFFMVRRLGLPFNASCQILPFGVYACKTGLNKNKKPTTIHLMLNLRDSEANPIDLNQISVQADLINKLRLGIESSVNLVPGTLRAIPIDLSNRPTICFSAATEPPMDFHLKVELDNPLAAQEAALISLYCDIDPRVRPLLLIILQWNELIGFMKSPDELFPHHVVSLMVIFYLVHKQILPSVHQICQEDKETRTKIFVQGYDVSFPKSFQFRKPQPELKDHSILALSVTGLLKGFFQFYGYGCDIYNSVFCVRLGCMISKGHFFSGNQSNLPNELQEMYSQDLGQLYTVGVLVLQDPFVLSLNLFKNRGKKPVSKFVGSCRRAHKLLEAGFNEEQPSLDVIFQQKEETTNAPVLYIPKF